MCCTRAASRVGALDLGFVPGTGGRDMAGILEGASKGEIEFVYLLGADEFDTSKLGKAFVVYQGTHGDAGAHRADVVLPGAAYTEKDGLYVNFEGRVQRAERAAFPPGDAKEDWAILRALSATSRARSCLTTIATDCAAPSLPRRHISQKPARCLQSAGADSAIWDAVGAVGNIDATLPLASPILDFYFTNPIARASLTMAECSKVFVSGARKMAAE